VSPAADRLSRAIVEERTARNPCPDVITYLVSLRGKSDDEIITALNDLDGDHE
jgi:hypothetical protein